MASFTDEQGRPLDKCPRSSLQSVIDEFEQDHQIDLLCGFEIEVTFCKRHSPDAEDAFAPLGTTHAWGTFTDEQYTYGMELVLTITRELQNIGIDLQKVHSEAGPGQYEFVLPPLPIVAAVDTLIQARQCITQIAATRGLRATCHPQPFPGIGTAAHAHLGFSSPLADIDLGKSTMSFGAAVLAHLPALCAFTMPQAASYARVVDDSWTGE